MDTDAPMGIYVLAWFPLILIAILNGMLRETLYGKRFRELRAHQISTLTAFFFFGLYIWTLGRLWRFESGAQALLVGLIWLAMTVCFEFLFGRYVARRPWSRLLHDYNLFAGRVWILLLLWITAAPYIIYRLQC